MLPRTAAIGFLHSHSVLNCVTVVDVVDNLESVEANIYYLVRRTRSEPPYSSRLSTTICSGEVFDVADPRVPLGREIPSHRIRQKLRQKLIFGHRLFS